MFFLVEQLSFQGISPSFEFSASPSIDDVTGLPMPPTKFRRQTKTVRLLRYSSTEKVALLIGKSIEITVIEIIIFIYKSVNHFYLFIYLISQLLK